MEDGEGGYAWFRAMYKTDLVDDRAQVHCIDYGHNNVVRANDIRVIRIGSLPFQTTNFEFEWNVLGNILLSFPHEIQAMSSDLEHEITSFVCYIKNGDTVSADKRVQFFIEHAEFKPTSLEYDAVNEQHVITVDFSGAQPASQ